MLTEVERATDAGRWAFGYVGYEAAGGLDRTLVVHQTMPLGMPLVWFGIGDPPISVPVVSATNPRSHRTVPAEWSSNWTPAEHSSRVAAIKSLIARGDIYQCNLTERMNGRVTGDPLALYRDLALGQGGAYNAYLDLGDGFAAGPFKQVKTRVNIDNIFDKDYLGTISTTVNTPASFRPGSHRTIQFTLSADF